MPTTKLRTKYIKQKKYKNCFRTRKIIGGNYNPHSTKKTKNAPITYITKKVKSLYTLKPSPHNEFIKTNIGFIKPNAMNVIKSRLGFRKSRNNLTNYKNLLGIVQATRAQKRRNTHNSIIKNVNPDILPLDVQRLHNKPEYIILSPPPKLPPDRTTKILSPQKIYKQTED